MRRSLIGAAALLCGASVLGGVAAHSLLMAAPGSASAPAGELPAPPARPVQPSGKNFRLEAARARLALAEASLAQVVARNRKVARSVPENIVAEYQQNVAVAQAFVAIAGGESFEAWLRHAEATARDTASAWRSATNANRAVQTIDPLEIERLRLAMVLGQRQLEAGRALRTAPPDQRLAWTLEVLYDDLARLDERTRRASPSVRTYIDYWY